MDIRLPETLKRFLPLWVFVFGAFTELVSYWGWHNPTVRVSAFALFGLAALAAAFLNLRWLYGLVMVEMMIGSHGRLLFWDVGGFSLSLRMLLFAFLAIGWGIHAARGCSRILHFRHARVTGPLLFLLGAVTFAAVRGWSMGAPLRDIFNDGNGYAFMLLIPIGFDLFADRKAFTWLARTLGGALAWLCAKSLLLLYLFSHAFDPAWLRDVFLWQRKFGLTEITHLSGGAERVFAASDIFLLPAIFFGVLLAWETRRRLVLPWTALVTAAFFLSLSRSFWLGAVVAAAFMLPVFLRFGIVPLSKLRRLFGVAGSVLALGGLLLALAVLSPWPQPTQTNTAWSVYGGRAIEASDAAVSSRWKMLQPLQDGIARFPIVGSGFGAQITYQSDDPRMHDLYPGGRVTTSAIEWQYLEIWLKMGLFGMIAVLWLWWRTGLSFWKALETAQGMDRLLAAGCLLAFLAFIVANIFTPYLNHPLGWAYLALLLVAAHAIQEQNTAAP